MNKQPNIGNAFNQGVVHTIDISVSLFLGFLIGGLIFIFALYAHELSHAVISIIISILHAQPQLPSFRNVEWVFGVLPIPHTTNAIDWPIGGFSFVRLAGPIGELMFYLAIVCVLTRDIRLRVFGAVWPLIMFYSNISNCPNSTDYLLTNLRLPCLPIGIREGYGLIILFLFFAVVFYPHIKNLRHELINKVNHHFLKPHISNPK